MKEDNKTVEATPEQVEAYSQKLLAKFKLDPYFDQKHEYGQLLMIHIDDFTPQQLLRYNELGEFLKDKY